MAGFYKDADGKAVPSTSGNHSAGTETPGTHPQKEIKSAFKSRQANVLAKGDPKSDRMTMLAAMKRRKGSHE